MTAPDSTPVTVSLGCSDVAYIVDALLDAADARRKRPASLHQRIADHLEGLAVMLDDAQPDHIRAGEQP